MRRHAEYLAVLDQLAGKERPTVEEDKYAEILLTLIEAYEEEHHAIADATPLQVLRTLMDANHLRQKDLAALFGSESIVSEVLHGKRGLSKANIEKLSERFAVSPAVFFQVVEAPSVPRFPQARIIIDEAETEHPPSTASPSRKSLRLTS